MAYRNKSCMVLGNKREENCIQANLDLEESGLREDQKMEILFRTQINNRLAEFEESVHEINNSGESECSSSHLTTKLNCITFSDVKPSKFGFKSFMAQFHNCTEYITSDKTKLAILKCYLTGYALQLISHYFGK